MLSAQPGVQRVAWNDILRQADGWYGSAEARAVADAVLAYQRASGGWPKNIDMTAPPADPAAVDGDATIDNGATYTQIRLLALVAAATNDARYRDAAVRGLDYVLSAQYPNGSWPQAFPISRAEIAQRDEAEGARGAEDAESTGRSWRRDRGTGGGGGLRSARHAIGRGSRGFTRMRSR